jgi:hypothetical protein
MPNGIHIWLKAFYIISPTATPWVYNAEWHPYMVENHLYHQPNANGLGL